MYARYIPPIKPSKAPETPNPRPAVPEREPSAPSAPAPQEVGGAGFSYSRYIPGSKPANKPSDERSIQYFDDEPSPASTKRNRNIETEPRDASPEPESKKSKKSKGKEANGAGDTQGTISEEFVAAEVKKSKKDKREKKAQNSQELEQDGDANAQDKASTSKKERKEKKSRKGPGAEDNSHDTPMTDANDHVDGQVNSTQDTASGPVKKKTKEKKREKESKDEQQDGVEDEEDEEDEEVAKEDRHKTVLERKAKSLKLASEAVREVGEDQFEAEPDEVHDLEPLPQPKLVSVEAPNPTYETLPSWLAAPIRVSQDTRTSFSELGLLPKAARILEEKGFPDAFAVQTVAIPLLLPTSNQRPGDLLISAATGSGKTLAYALPIVRDLSQGLVTRLRTLVVLPTRELVKQAQEVFELCARAYEGGERKRVRIGVAIGSQTLKSEQENLIERESRYDPAAYKRIRQQRRGGPRTNGANSSDIDGFFDPGYDGSDPRLGAWEGDVVDFSSKVDVLICTPGRLVEHIEQTPGFDLDYVRWLVVDEADKLLAQSFQGWLDVVLEKFQTRKFTAREFPAMDLEGVRKVVLSATLTRDLSLLNQLALRRPQLIVLESDWDVQVAEHSLPAPLQEFAIRVHNTNLKPLYLLDLLKGGHMTNPNPDSRWPPAAKAEGSSDSDATSDTSSDSSSDSDTSSDSDSDSESEPDTQVRPKSTLPISLVFTKSNESALRLSRLLTLLDKSLSPHISTLTSTTPTHIRRKTLRAFTAPSSSIRLIIASDLVARGIDLPNLDHVINYDLPPSVAGYVHRVGRTARAGRSGRAWTLIGDDESGWFWGKIAKGASVRRAQKVGRVRIEEMDEKRVESYEAALEKLGQEALVTKKR